MALPTVGALFGAVRIFVKNFVIHFIMSKKMVRSECLGLVKHIYLIQTIYYSKKVLHHQIFTKIYKYHCFLSIPNLNFKFDTALEDSIQYLTQQ